MRGKRISTRVLSAILSASLVLGGLAQPVLATEVLCGVESINETDPEAGKETQAPETEAQPTQTEAPSEETPSEEAPSEEIPSESASEEEAGEGGAEEGLQEDQTSAPETTPQTESDSSSSEAASGDDTETEETAGVMAAAESDSDDGDEKETGEEETEETDPDAEIELSVSSPGIDALQKENGVILYTPMIDGAQTINVSVPVTAFQGTDVTLTVTLPDYGMAFADNLAANLSDQAEVKKATLSKDGNGRYRTLTIVLDGNMKTTYLTALATKYVPLTNGQCEDVIQNGYHDSKITCKLTKGKEELAFNDEYVMRPVDGVKADINVADHAWTTAPRAEWVNRSPWYDNKPMDYTLYNMDAFKITVPTVGYQGTQLVKLNEIRIYSPDKDLKYGGMANTTYNNGYGHRFGPTIDYSANDAKRYFGDYFSTDGIAQTDENGNEYYVFKPKSTKVYYNNGVNTVDNDAYRKDIAYGGYIRWMTKEGVDSLEPDHEYQAPNVVISYTTIGGQETVRDAGPGFKVTTLRREEKVGYKYSANTKFGRYYDKNTDKYTCETKVVPGASYVNQYFNSISNTDTLTTGVEQHTVRGTTTEVFEFPYEVQPTNWNTSISSKMTVALLESVTYTILDANGNETEKTVKYDRAVSTGVLEMTDFSADLEAVGEGARVNKVVVKWDKILGTQVGIYSRFDFKITETHEDGSDFEYGEFVKVNYQADCEEANKHASYPADHQTFMYMQVVAKKCPFLADTGYSYQQYNAKELNDQEVVLAKFLGLKGTSGGSTKESMNNPVIRLDVDTRNIANMDDATSMLSGNMTLTRNMSNWKISYKVYDTASRTSRNGGYQIPELAGDTPLTREDLGVSDTEFFTEFVMSYDGEFLFREITTVNQGGSVNDGTQAGLYDYTYLLKDVKAYCRSTTLYTGEMLQCPESPYIQINNDDGSGPCATMRFMANLKHDGDCNRSGHTSEAGEWAADTEYWNWPNFALFNSYRYIVKDPGFAASGNATVSQGSTAEFTLNMTLGLMADTYRVNTNHRNMPYDVPETIYIQLKDDQFTVDTSNVNFQKSLAAHGMTTDDVSVVTIGDKKWIRLSTGDRNSVYTTRAAQEAPVYNTKKPRTNNQFTIALRAWSGAKIEDHNPLGEVYYDISDLLTKYDGSSESGFRQILFDGAVADPYDLLGDGDDTTLRLWKGDMRSVSIEVLRNTVTGVTIAPGKAGQVDNSGSVTFLPHEEDLMASVTIKAPETKVKEYTTIIKLPRKGERTKYHYVEGGKVKTGEKENDLDLCLQGPARSANSSLDEDSTVQYSYSKDGETWKTEAEIADDDWPNYRYIKTVINVIYPYKGVETTFPVSCGTIKDKVGDWKGYAGGTWSYIDDGKDKKVEGMIYPAEYVMTDYAITGNLWFDKDENGINDENAPAKDITVRVIAGTSGQDTSRGAARESDLIDKTKTEEDGSYRLRTYSNQEGQKFEVVLPDEKTMATKQSSANPEKNGLDSDIRRQDNSCELPVVPGTTLINIGAGLIHMQGLTAKPGKLHVGEGKNAYDLFIESIQTDNPNKNTLIKTYSEPDEAGYKVTQGTVTGKATGKYTIAKVCFLGNTLSKSDQKLDKDVVSADGELTVYNKVFYDGNGAETGAVPVDGKEYWPDAKNTESDKVTVSDFEEGLELTRTGYSFLGWSENQDAKEADYQAGDTFTTGSRPADITLYAVWEMIPETEAPTEPTEAPTEPTEAPTEPTEAPTKPTEAPTEAPVQPTEAQVTTPVTEKPEETDKKQESEKKETEKKKEKQEEKSQNTAQPDTSDRTNIAIWVVLMAVGLFFITSAFVYKKKNKKRLSRRR